MREEDVKNSLVKKFADLEGHIRVQRARRISVDVDQKDFKNVFEYAINELKFQILCAITGLDEGPTLGFIYHIATEDGIILNLKVSVPKDRPALKTITNYFPCADVYERELVDLLGAKVEGLSEGNRYPLTDDWPKDEYPLRKDWKPIKAKGA